jgi:peptide/nickel transport system permease protein
MFAYIVRRLLYSIPIVLGVMLITFILFFVVQSREVMARAQLGQRATPVEVMTWLRERGYDKPVVVNASWTRDQFYRADRPWTDSIFIQQMKSFATFDFGESDFNRESIGQKLRSGAIPSLLITAPALVVGLVLAVSLALLQVMYRASALDTAMTVGCAVLMSVVPMAYIITAQNLMAVSLKWFPAFGFDLQGWGTVRFLALPVTVMAIIYLGADVRLYRSIFLEEIAQDYVRTAQAKGLSPRVVLFKHVLKNGAISLITLVVAYLPLLIMGSLLIENFFGIPGLGGLVVNAIQKQDFAIVRAAVFVGSLLYLLGLMLTDICYAVADPRIRLQ